MTTQIQKQLDASSFQKENEGKYSIELRTINGVLDVKIFVSDIEVSIHITHNSISESYYLASPKNLDKFVLDTFVNESILAFFEEITNRYIARYSVQ